MSSDDRIDFELLMRDSVTPAAGKAGASLSRLAAQMRANARAQEAIDRKRAASSKNADALARYDLRVQKRALAESIRTEKKRLAHSAAASRQMRAGFASVGGMLGGGAMLALGAVMAGFGALAFGIAHAAKEADLLQFSLQKLTGKKDEFSTIAMLANDLGLGIQSTAHSYSRLLKMQFGREQARTWLKFGADLKALGNTTEEVEGIMLAVSQIKAKNKLQQQELNQLAERGVSVELVRQALAEKTGKSVAEVIKMQEAGKIDFGMAEAAIQTAIMRKLHITSAGEAAEAYAKTFAGGMDRASSTIERVQLGLGTQFAKGAMAGGGGIGEFFKSLDSGGGSGIVRTLGTAANQLGAIFSQIGPPILEVLSALTVGFTEGLGLGTFSENGKLIALVIKEQIVPAVRSIGTVMGFVVHAFGLGVSLITVGVSTIVNAITGIPGALGAVWEGMKNVGVRIVQGIVAGFTSAWEGAKNLIPSKLASLLDIVQTDQEIHSPSRKWAREVGAPIAQGTVGGADREFARLGAPSVPMAAVGSQTNKSVGGTGINVGGITIHVTASGDPKSIAESVMQAFESNLEMTFGRVFAGVGA